MSDVEKKEECGSCGKYTISVEKNKEIPFEFGAGEDRVTLTCKTSVYTCSECGFSYLDSDAEAAKLEAMYAHVSKLNLGLKKQLEEAIKVNEIKESRVVQLIAQVRERDSIIRSMRAVTG